MKVLVVEVAALGWDLVAHSGDAFRDLGIPLSPALPPFPAVTCCAQAVFRTGLPLEQTGIACNGRYDRITCKTDFWNQSARLVRGPRIWDGARQRGQRVGLLFWQQSLGEKVDILLSPTPVHKHHGGMIQDCTSKPPALYDKLRQRLGRPFNLMRYWGPMASIESSAWITAATLHVMEHEAPEILFTYLPHLDYALQKYGPQNQKTTNAAVKQLLPLLAELVNGARHHGYEIVLWGDYAITPAERVVLPNRALREAGLFRVRQIRKMTYPDLYESPAFAMVDHQVAHVYLQSHEQLGATRSCLEKLPGIACVALGHNAGSDAAGDLVLTAEPGAWFAYPWWENPGEAPDYASHVDIHNKIGFDPCELFWGWPPPSISRNAARVRGTHGRSDIPVAVGSTLSGLQGAPSLQALAQRLGTLLDNFCPPPEDRAEDKTRTARALDSPPE